MADYIEHYQIQIGYGRGIERVYVGSPYQRGRGIGSFLGGLFRTILPLIKRGARAVGKEAVRAGTNVVSDIIDDGVPFRESLRSRLGESGKNLKRKAEEKIEKMMMKGSGYKTAKRPKKAHSRKRPASRNISKNRKKVKRVKNKRSKKVKKRPISDIFS